MFGEACYRSSLHELTKCAEDCKEGQWLSSGALTITCSITFEEDSTSKGLTELSDNIAELYKNGKDCDVTLLLKGKTFHAHRCILMARSAVFEKMLTHDTKERETGEITIEDCDPDSFGDFLHFVYSGRTVNLTLSKALSLYYVADKYYFHSLKEQCVSFMKTSLSTSSVCEVVLLAARHWEKDLLEIGTSFFARNIKEVILTVEWQNFLCEHPVEAKELLIKSLH